jgi:uncharacterized protein YjbI with pentapeptide repeats
MSLDFDGSNDYVTVANIGTLSSLTVEFWMYNTDSGNGGRYAQMVGRGANGNGWDWSVYLQSVSVANTLRWVGPGGTTIDTDVIPLNTWTHIAVTCNNVQTKIYINAALSTTQSTTNAMTNQTNAVMFGNDVSFTRPYKGRLSEIRIWNIIRSASDISTYCNSNLVGNETGLIGYYKLNSTSGSTAVDTSTSARNGTLSNFTLSGATSNWVNSGPSLGIIPTIGALATIPTKMLGIDVSFNIVDPSSNSSGAFTFSSSNTGVATLTRPNITPNALHFDGVNDTVALSSYPALNSTQLTIEGWFYTTGYSKQLVMINSNTSFEIDAQGKIMLYVVTVGSGGTAILSDSAIPLNAWVYIAAVKNDNGYNKIYVNNTIVKNAADTTSGALVAATGLSLGSDAQANSKYSNISMSELRIWTVARTAQQLTDTYNIRIPSNSSGLAIYYKFIQGTANGTNTGLTTLTDSTSNNYHGTLQGFALSGTTSNWVPGPNTNPNALQFEGINDTVALSSYPALNSTNTLTLEAWIYITTQGEQGVITLNEIGGCGLTLGKFGIGFRYNPSGWQPTVISDTAIPINTWTHVAGVLNDGGYTKLYINGTLVKSVAGSGNFYPCGGISLAANAAASSGYSNISMSDIRIWTVARTAQQIADNYKSQIPSNSTGLVIYYKFNQGAANETNTGLTTLTNSASNNYHGTLQGFALTGTTSNWVSGPNRTSPNALSLDGVNDKVVISSNPTFTYTSQLTMEGWVFIRSFPSAIVALSGFTGIDILADGKISTWINFAGNGWLNVTSDSSVPLNSWAYIAVVINDSGYNKMYVNNTLIKNSVNTGSGVFAANTDIVFGGVNQAYSIMLSEFRFWSVARTAQQLTDNYNSQIPSNSSGLVIYYKFNQGSANGTNTGLTTLTDSTSNNYHGTLQGFALTGTTSNWVSGPNRTSPIVCTIVGPGTSSITATQASDVLYGSASVSTTLTVNALLPTFGTFTLGPKSGTYLLADVSFSLTAPTSDSSGAFSYTSDNSAVAVITRNQLVTTNLLAQYDASVATSYTLSGSNVTQWNDLTGNGYHLIPNGTGPTLTTIKTLSALNFNSGYGLLRTSVPLSTSITVFMVAKYSTAIAAWGAFMHHGHRDTDWSLERNAASSQVQFQINDDNTFCQIAAANNTNYLWIGRITGNTRDFWMYSDTLAPVYVTSSTPVVTISGGNKTLYVGKSDNNEATNGSIGEILYYNASLSNADVSANLLYLQNKWFNGLSATGPGVTLVGSGTANITATQDVCGNYMSKSVSSLLTVGQLPTFGTFTLGPKSGAYELADASFSLTAPTSDSSGAFSYTSDNSAVAVIPPTPTFTTFTTVGTTNWVVPAGITSVSALIVGGGGGGGRDNGGGGGGGGVIVNTNIAVTPGASMNIVVGSGGAAAASTSTVGSNGGNSSFAGLVAVGGGGGGSLFNTVGANGGSAGGRGGGAAASAVSGTVTTTPLQGNNGGGSSGGYGGGGGGGSGQVGAAGGSNLGGKGGDGIANSITTSTVYYGGGGGGGGNGSTAGAGGIGGGGAGVAFGSQTPTAGINGLGGGGGGGGGSNAAGPGAVGGSGIVIISYGTTIPQVTLVGSGTANITATQDACGNYMNKSVSSLLSVVNPVTPTLGTFTVPSPKAYGDASFNISLRPTSDSSGAITYSSSNPSVATIDASGNWINIVGVGDVSFNALQAAVSGQYTSATKTSNTLTVSKATPVYQPISQVSKTFGVDVSFSLSAIMAGVSTSNGSYTFSTDVSVNALKFNGTNNYIDFGANIVELGKSSFTIECWIKTSGTRMGLLNCQNSDSTWGTGEKSLYIDNSGIPVFVGFGCNYIYPTVAVNDNAWHHIAVTWLYTGGTSGTPTFYIDGINRTGTTHPQYPSYTANTFNVGTFVFGKPNYQESVNFFNGSVCELRIWNVARSASEIFQNYRRTLTGNETGLVAYNRFNQGIANGSNSGLTTATNNMLSGGYTGSLFNFSLVGSTSNWTDGIALSNVTSYISISGDVATILEYTPSAITVTASQAVTTQYNVGSTTFSLLIARGTPSYQAISQVTKTVGVDASFSLSTIMAGVSTSNGSYTFSSPETTSTTILSTNNMNNVTGGSFTGGQYQSNLKVAVGVDLVGWTEDGTNHIVDIANTVGQTNTPNYVMMFWYTHTITQTTAVSDSNILNTIYTVNFKAGPAVYQNGTQATGGTASDGIVFEILRANDTVLATSTYLPGAWAGYPTLTASSFTYTGDGTGNIRMRIKPAASGTGRFYGCVDDVVISSTVARYISISGDVATILEYTPSAITVTASQAVTTQYNVGSTTFSLLISRRTPSLSSATFTVPSPKLYGDASFSVFTRPVSDNSGAITYTSSNTSVATIDASGNFITIVGLGDVSFNATQAETSLFNAATRTSNTLTVSKATISLAFVNPPTTKNVTDAAFTVTATGARPDAVTYSSSNTALATVNSSTGLVTLKSAGTVIITASQASTEFYNVSTATCSIVIASAGTTLQGQTISSSASFASVDLSGASLVGTTVSGVSFSSANLRNVDFSGAVITGTNFSNANISGATNLPAFSTVQKLQLLKNINNVGIGAVQFNAPISGADINSLLATPNNQVAAATFTVKAPTAVDASANKIVSISSEDIAGNKSIYIPINENEPVKLNNIVYSFNGTNLLDASGNVVTFLMTQNTPFKIYAGSIVALNIQDTLNRITILGDGLYNILHDILQPKAV